MTAAFAAVKPMQRHSIKLLVLFYFVVLLPPMMNVSRYHGDELFYTNGAVRMLLSGDYVTPRYGGGSPRFRKPAFTYWTIAASYKIFGINLFASRIPFLAAGCLLLLFCYKISLSLFHREEKAWIAAIILGSNLQLLTLALRSTPDILQAFFISASLYGFINLIFNESKSFSDYAFAYLGAALTIATKGFLGIFPIVFAFAFAKIRKKDKIRIKGLISFKILPPAFFIAFLWFALILHKHGLSAVTCFLGDQVTERVSGSKIYILRNFASYSLALVRHFIPWSIILALALLKERPRIAEFVKRNKNATIFIAGWYLLLFAIFLGGNLTRTRYLFPAYPLVAVLFSAILTDLTKSRFVVRALAITEKIYVGAVFASGLCMVLAGYYLGSRIFAGGLLSLTAGFILALLRYQQRIASRFTVVALAFVIIYSAFFTFAKPVFFVSPAPVIAKRILAMDKGDIKVAAIGFPRDFLNQMPIFSGGKIIVKKLQSNTPLNIIDRYQVIILSENERKTWNLSGYHIEKCGYSYEERWKLHDVLGLMESPDKSEYLEKRKQNYYLAVRDEG